MMPATDSDTNGIVAFKTYGHVALCPASICMLRPFFDLMCMDVFGPADLACV